MAPFRIAILGSSPCAECGANCCRQIGHAFAVLLRPEEYGRFGPFSIVVPIHGDGGTPVSERVLPYVDGRCQFLGPDQRCAIYEDRPRSCREFECVKFYYRAGRARHGRFLELNPDVLQRLEAL